MIEKEWIPFIATLSGVLVGGFITTFAKFLELKHQRKQDNKKLLINKLEELNASINDLHNYFNKFGLKVKRLPFSNANDDIAVNSEEVIKSEGIEKKTHTDNLEYYELLDEISVYVSKISNLSDLYLSESRHLYKQMIGNLKELDAASKIYLKDKETYNNVDEKRRAIQTSLSEFSREVTKKVITILH